MSLGNFYCWTIHKDKACTFGRREIYSSLDLHEYSSYSDTYHLLQSDLYWKTLTCLLVDLRLADFNESAKIVTSLKLSHLTALLPVGICHQKYCPPKNGQEKMADLAIVWTAKKTEVSWVIFFPTSGCNIIVNTVYRTLLIRIAWDQLASSPGWCFSDITVVEK